MDLYTETSSGLSASEIVARGCESIALAVKTVTNLARRRLPAAEARRLDALAQGLENVAYALKAGQIDLRTAKTTVRSVFAVALDSLGSIGMAALAISLGSWATSLTPSPVVKALGIAGFGAIGLALDWKISDSQAADTLAGVLTDALFDGAEALSTAITRLIEETHAGLRQMPGFPTLPDEFLFDLGAELDSSSGQARGTVYLDGNETPFAASPIETIVFNDPSSASGDPKTPWNDPSPIT